MTSIKLNLDADSDVAKAIEALVKENDRLSNELRAFKNIKTSLCRECGEYTPPRHSFCSTKCARAFLAMEKKLNKKGAK